MVPAAYVVLHALPLNPNGKLDRSALPAPDDSAQVTRHYEQPVGEVETELARIWADVLQLDRVGRHDHFFELGGHSLLAVSVIERMRSCGLDADVGALFTSPTLSELAAAVREERPRVHVPANAIPPGCTRITPSMLPLVSLTQEQIDRIADGVDGGAANVQDVYPLAALQEGILFHHRMGGAGDVYLMPALFTFDSRARLDGYVQALQAVVDRHDILRTSVHWEGLPEPVQVVWRRAPLQVEEVALPHGDAAGALEQLSRRLDPRRFRIDVREAPLIRLYAARDEINNRWAMVLLFHHLVADHTTQEIVQQEVQLELLGRGGELAEPKAFREFVAQARLGMPRQAHEAFFRRMLGTVEEPTAPYGLLDVQGDGSAIVQAQRAVEPALARRLRERARHLGVSAASVFHLACAQLLARLVGREDVVFGTVLFGRMQSGADAQRVPGLFINTLPLRVQLQGLGVREGVQRTHELLTQLVRHEHAPLALAQRCSQVAAPAPLFSALLNYRHSPQPQQLDAPLLAQQAQAWQGVQFLGGEERTNYPFTLAVDDWGDGFGLTAQVQSPAHADEVCAFMHTALEQIVQALERAPQTALQQLDVLPAAQRDRLLALGTGVQREARGGWAHEWIEAQARRRPDAIAVVQRDRRLSYAQLNEQANRLAHHLREHGVGPDARVALCMPRGIQMVVGLLAVLKAGGAYVPVDPSYPAQRLQRMCRDSAPVVVLSASSLSTQLDPGVPVLDLDADAWRWALQPAGNPQPALHGEHLAYVIYTSGSTGTPKAAQVLQQGLRNLMDWYLEDLPLGEDDAVLLVTSHSFDLTQKNILGPLMVGATLHLAAEPFDPSAIVAQVHDQRITVLNMAPSAFHALLDARRGDELAGLRRVVLGGEPIQVGKLMQLPEPRPQFVNSYGPTECSDVVAYHCLSPRLEDYAGRSVPLGQPIRNTRLYVLDAHARLAPEGVAGELCIAGTGVGRGYLHQPQLTAERFVSDPFAPGQRMYRTGDLARYLADGTLEFLGRNDFQVKIRGMRVELGEIEACLARFDGVREAVVIARGNGDGDDGKRLVAYLVGENLNPQALREHAALTLPQHMVPAAYVVLHALPLNPNGKLDRSALPAPDDSAQVTRHYEQPVGEVETELARIWADVLQLDRVGRHDHFFELGGHSLLAVSVIERMRSCGLDADVGALFTSPTLTAFAAATEEMEIVL
jgi:amino acid adenylation domain-containing protein